MATWTLVQVQTAREIVSIARKFRREAGGRVPDLAMLAGCLQESGLNPQAVGDNGQSFGPFQIYQVAHPDTSELALSPWADYAYGLICFGPWESAWASLSGDTVWQQPSNRPAFLEVFVPRAQSSVPWGTGTGLQRYAEALELLELIS